MSSLNTAPAPQAFSLFESYWSAEPLIQLMKPNLPSVKAVGASVMPDCYEIGGEMYFSRLVTCPQLQHAWPTDVEFGVTRFANRDRDIPVYITARRDSSFYGTTNILLTLMEEGYELYPVDEHLHSDVTLLPLVIEPVKDAKLIRTRKYREGLKLTSQWDSSFAFIAMPPGDGAPSAKYLVRLSNWLNCFGHSFQVLRAKPVKADALSGYEIEVIEEGPLLFSREDAQRDAESALLAYALGKHSLND